VSSEDVREGKPSPEGFLLALDRLRERGTDAAPRDCVVVEDSQPGVEAARRAGMRCVAITNSHARDALTGADLIVGSLVEVGWERLSAL
jgi:beta-phosphoglucomutase-like phosphatase (HAD superfamily)